MKTSRTDLWREKVRRRLDKPGEKVALARFLCDGDEAKLPIAQVQVARVLNQGRMPAAEFVLAVEEWIAKTGRNQKERRKTQA